MLILFMFMSLIHVQIFSALPYIPLHEGGAEFFFVSLVFISFPFLTFLSLVSILIPLFFMFLLILFLFPLFDWVAYMAFFLSFSSFWSSGGIQTGTFLK